MTRTGRRIGLGLIITALLIAMVVAFVKIGKDRKDKRPYTYRLQYRNVVCRRRFGNQVGPRDKK